MAATAFAVAALGFGGCAQNPQQLSAAASHGKEYFPSSVYGSASRRVVADGQAVPRGGGQYLVGRPYTIAGQTYYPSERRVVQIGTASWYGDAFHGRLTANGEVYDKDSFTAAHPTMPLPSYARVTNLANNYSMIVRVNDRGPYASNRVMDVSRRVAEALDFKRMGTAKIKVEYVGRASLAGSDDQKLYATLRQDAPARWQGEAPSMVAEAQPIPQRTRVASLSPFVPAPVERPQRAPVSDERTSSFVSTVDRDAAPRHHHTIVADADARDDTRHQGAGLRPRFASAGDDAANRRAARFALAELSHPAATQPTRGAKAGPLVLPPSRPIDLRTSAAAASPLDRRHGVALRMARARDDD